MIALRTRATKPERRLETAKRLVRRTEQINRDRYGKKWLRRIDNPFAPTPHRGGVEKTTPPRWAGHYAFSTVRATRSSPLSTPCTFTFRAFACS